MNSAHEGGRPVLQVFGIECLLSCRPRSYHKREKLGGYLVRGKKFDKTAKVKHAKRQKGACGLSHTLPVDWLSFGCSVNSV